MREGLIGVGRQISAKEIEYAGRLYSVKARVGVLKWGLASGH